ncbi:hypothetical protein ABIC31_000376 [Paraburkholderia caledonica]
MPEAGGQFAINRTLLQAGGRQPCAQPSGAVATRLLKAIS